MEKPTTCGVGKWRYFSSRLWENYSDTLEFDGLHPWHNGRTLQQDAQKGQTSHPFNPGSYFTRPP